MIVNRASLVLQRVRGEILNFRLMPGMKISDIEIAEQMGISRTPVREALIRLAEQGLVESRPNHGFTVRIFTAEEVKDIYLVREALEVLAVGLATENMTEKRAFDLTDLLADYPELLQTGTPFDLDEIDQAFHDRIAKYSDNELLAQKLGGINSQVRIIRRYERFRPTSYVETMEEHNQILNRMLAGDADGACSLMGRHIGNSRDDIVQMLDKLNRA
jgi:DNA-binding GntR family transcriptional regulator